MNQQTELAILMAQVQDTKAVNERLKQKLKEAEDDLAIFR